MVAKASVLFGSLAMVVAAGTANAQCELLVRETFRLGMRPHGGNGRLRDAEIHDTLHDYWPQVPNDGTRWISTDQSGVPSWGFAAASDDPAEVDALDPDNGTAFGEATAAALLPFSAPAGVFTVSAEAFQVLGSTSATYLGYTSSPATFSNFASHGALWLSLNGSGEWAIRANGNEVVAQGIAPISGTLDSGWLHMELTYDPAASMVSGRVMDTAIAAVPVSLATPIGYFGIEAFDSWNVVNNISIFTGTPLHVEVGGPGSVALGGIAVFSAATNAAEPARFFWTRNGQLLTDGVQSWGSGISGSRSTQLTVAGLTAEDAAEYRCIVANECGQATSAVVTISFCRADFDGDGFVSGSDYDLFVGAFESGDPAADFDRDGFITGEDFDRYVVEFEAGC